MSTAPSNQSLFSMADDCATQVLISRGMILFKKPKTALIAGVAGFLGSHLADRLLSLGFDVLGIDNLQTGDLRNLVHLRGNNHFRFLELDINFAFDEHVDIVFNLACPASPVHYQADPIQTIKTSVIGTLNLLELATRHGATMVQASTSEVYGDPLQHPQNEDYWGHVNPIGDRACYDEGKRAAETLCVDFFRKHDTDTRIARIFNTYGPRMLPEDGRAVSNFIVQALKGEPITVYGDGLQTRSFCYVDDLIGGLVSISASGVPSATPINIGNPEEITIVALAEMIRDLVGTHSEIASYPLPGDDPRQRRPNISRASRLLDWSPKIGLREGLSKTVEYFKAIDQLLAYQ